MNRVNSGNPKTFRFARSVLVAAATATVVWVNAGDLNPPVGPILPTNRVQINEQTVTLPYLISQPGSYVLTSNLAAIAPGHGIRIESDDVTLDLNGFTLTGFPSGGGNGVHVGGTHTNIAILNGIVTACSGVGINAASADHCRLSGLLLSNNDGGGVHVGSNSLVTGLSATANGNAGIRAVGDGNRIDSCHVTNNSEGIAVDGAENLIVRNSARDNGNDYSIATGNAYGPIALVGGVGDITSVVAASHPWANFSLACQLQNWCRDADGDGFGNPGDQVSACVAPIGYVADCTDCDDFEPGTFPGAAEVCDGADNNCDGQIDEGGAGQQTFCRDLDGDGFGDPSNQIQSCPPPPAGFVSDCTDCNDFDSSINPGAVEVCNGQDDDCNGQIDDGVGSTWCRDLDGDGFGNPGDTTQACSAPPGYVADCTDCNDFNATVFPGATEQCNNLDDDCDGTVDDGNPGGGAACNTGLPGICAAGTTVCQSGTINCQQNNFPTGEVCDGLDNNCNGTVDDGVCLANGAGCSSGSQCTSGFCVDGVCCNGACAAVCQACSAAKKGSGADGTCGFIAAGTDPDSECSGGTPNCDGGGACGP